MATANTLWFAKPDAMQGSVLDTLRVVRPTLFLADPFIWTKLKAVASAEVKQTEWTLKKGTEGSMRQQRGQTSSGFKFKMADRQVHIHGVSDLNWMPLPRLFCGFFFLSLANISLVLFRSFALALILHLGLTQTYKCTRFGLSGLFQSEKNARPKQLPPSTFGLRPTGDRDNGILLLGQFSHLRYLWTHRVVRYCHAVNTGYCPARLSRKTLCWHPGERAWVLGVPCCLWLGLVLISILLVTLRYA